MDKKEKTCRFTIDIPKDAHQQLKVFAAKQDKSMREIVIECITMKLAERKSEQGPINTRD